MTKPILPPATLGIVGGGQLGQMMALAAKPMGYRVVVLDPQINAPAAQIADQQLVANYDDESALRNLADIADVITYEFENVSQEALANAVPAKQLPQGTQLLHITANRLREKTFIADLGLPVAPFAAVDNVVALDASCHKVSLPAILKTVEGGYDGHGQWDIPNQEALANLLAHWDVPVNTPMILEKQITFDRELSVMVARDISGEIRTWPVTVNEHQNHILHVSAAPASLSDKIADEIAHIAKTLANALNLVGVLGIEMFVAGDQVYVNELAPRPHNSGHFTIEATNVSQFEGHVRSVLGLPIPEIKQWAPAMMLNLLGDDINRARRELVDHPEWHIHDYGKDEVKPGRKMGHITVTGLREMKALRAWGHQKG